MQQAELDVFTQACKEILYLIENTENCTKKEANKIKLKVIKKYKIIKVPTQIDLTAIASESQRIKLREILSLKPVRTISGVMPVALMSEPYPCPHGTCTYCPGGPGSFYGDVPKSYTGHEPSTMRAIRANYDSYLIVFNRLEQYAAMNRLPDKIELIVQGGTFPFFPEEYQVNFIGYAFKAMNDFSEIFFENSEINRDKFN